MFGAQTGKMLKALHQQSGCLVSNAVVLGENSSFTKVSILWGWWWNPYIYAVVRPEKRRWVKLTRCEGDCLQACQVRNPCTRPPRSTGSALLFRDVCGKWPGMRTPETLVRALLGQADRPFFRLIHPGLIQRLNWPVACRSNPETQLTGSMQV